jgi:hypothetical protein
VISTSLGVFCDNQRLAISSSVKLLSPMPKLIADKCVASNNWWESKPSLVLDAPRITMAAFRCRIQKGYSYRRACRASLHPPQFGVTPPPSASSSHCFCRLKCRTPNNEQNTIAAMETERMYVFPQLKDFTVNARPL